MILSFAYDVALSSAADKDSAGSAAVLNAVLLEPILFLT
jgi:hypothetical protein